VGQGPPYLGPINLWSVVGSVLLCVFAPLRLCVFLGGRVGLVPCTLGLFSVWPEIPVESIAIPIAIPKAIAGRNLAAFGRAAFEVAATDKRSRWVDAAPVDARREL
jgi:hypothetical protein